MSFSISKLILLVLVMFSWSAAHADEDQDAAVATCMKAWGDKNPFAAHSKYKVLATSVKVFGIGKDIKDEEVTSSPALVLVSPGVNVMGGTTYELLNPNGWYCFRTDVNVMGGLTIKAHCKAHIASTTGATTVMANDNSNKGVTVMGKTRVEFVHCE